MSDLSVFSNPRSVAVVGASADPAKWGYWLARGALRGANRRSVHLINARGITIDGVATARSLGELETPPELVVLCTPPSRIEAAVNDAIMAGARGFLGITSGLDRFETGLEQRITAQIVASGARLVGPNCLGIFDADTDLELAWGTFTPGHIAIISQSGQLGLELSGLARHAGLGISRFVSIGNQADVSARELLADVVGHNASKVVILYLESFTHGRELLAVLAALRAADRPVVVLTVGTSDAGRSAAESHTGAMTSSRDVVAAACRSAGAILVDTPIEAINVAHLLLGSPLPRGRRIAVVSDSGGQGAMAADVLTNSGLIVPHLGEPAKQRLRDLLPPAASVSNPVDLAGAGEQDLTSYAQVVAAVAASGDVDAIVLSGYFGCYGDDTPELQERELEVVGQLADTVTTHQLPVIVHSMSYDSAAVRSMRQRLVPALHTIDAVARSLQLITTLAEPAHLPAAIPADVTAYDAAATPAVAGATMPLTLDYLAARKLLEHVGITYPRVAVITSATDIAGLLADWPGPYVLKAGHLAHKTEYGGVILGLHNADEVRRAYQDMSQRLAAHPDVTAAPQYIIEAADTRPDTVELIVGGRRDAAFGPVVMVGLGGITAELRPDISLALAPVTRKQAAAMVHSLDGAQFMTGWRGRPAVDIDAAAATILAVSDLLISHPTITECEINPLRVGPHGALALDGLAVTTENPQGAP